MFGHPEPRRILGVCTLAAFFALIVASTSEAQVQTGNLYGTVVDEQGSPLPGAKVTLNGPQGEQRVHVSNVQGEFYFLGLAPGAYSLRSELDGFSTIDYPNVHVNVARSTTIEIRQVAVLDDEIRVTRESPLLDERRTSTGRTVNRAEVEQTPGARDPWAILERTPGVLTDRINIGGTESGRQSTYVSGGSQKQQNTFAVDGVVITDMETLGTSPAYYDFDSFEEMEITTGGADATIATGGVVLNMVTKRGTNEWRGSGHYFGSEEGLNGDWNDDFHNLPGADFRQGGRLTSLNDYGAELGGPIIRDRLWIWGSHGAQDMDQRTIADVESFSHLSSTGIKLNTRLSPLNIADFSTFINDRDANWIGRDAARRTQDTTWNIDRLRDTAIKIEDKHIFSSNFYLTGLYSRVSGGFDFVPEGGENRVATFSQVDGAWHDTFNVISTDRKQEQVKLDASSFFNTGSLSHELKYGASYRHADVEKEESWPGFAVNLDDVTFAVPGSHSTTHGSYSSAWLQDTLSIGNVTFNFGLRYDDQGGSWEGSRDQHPTFQSLLPGVSFEERDLDFDSRTITPRLGLTYGAGWAPDTVIRLNFGQYPLVLTPDQIDLIRPVGMDRFSGSAVLQNGALVGFIPPLQNTAGAQQPLGVFDENVRTPIQTDLLLGVEHALLPEFVVGLNLTYRTLANLLEESPIVREGNTERPATADDYVLFGQASANIDGQTFTENVYTLRSSLFRTDSDFITNSDARTESMQASVTFTKRLANRWMLRGNITKLNWDWDVSDQARGNQDPTRILQQPRDSDPRTEQSTDVSSRGVYLGPGWSYSINGLYQIAPDRPWGFNAAFNLLGRQGHFDKPFRVIARPDNTTAAVQFGEESRLENQHYVDVGFQKEFTFGDVGVTLGLDVFNVLNNAYVNQLNGDLDQGRFVTEITSPRTFRIGGRLSFR